MYRGGDELKMKLQQLREGMGYYDQRSNQSVLDSKSSVNNQIFLPELKSITPMMHNMQKKSSNNHNKKKSM